jgi:hypothetical protein
MVVEVAHDRQWESQAEVDAVLFETETTKYQVRRWRREGLLSKEIDTHANVVRYPWAPARRSRRRLRSSRKRNASTTWACGYGGKAFR